VADWLGLGWVCGYRVGRGGGGWLAGMGVGGWLAGWAWGV
jgi:hypothetical protein